MNNSGKTIYFLFQPDAAIFSNQYILQNYIYSKYLKLLKIINIKYIVIFL